MGVFALANPPRACSPCLITLSPAATSTSTKPFTRYLICSSSMLRTSDREVGGLGQQRTQARRPSSPGKQRAIADPRDDRLYLLLSLRGTLLRIIILQLFMVIAAAGTGAWRVNDNCGPVRYSRQAHRIATRRRCPSTCRRVLLVSFSTPSIWICSVATGASGSDGLDELQPMLTSGLRARRCLVGA